MRPMHSAGLGNAMELTEFVFNPKEGIDNPAMVITEEGEKASGPSPRVCVLKKEEGEHFGFQLVHKKGQRGHIVKTVEKGGLAEKGGMRNGDRILEINEHFVDDFTHMEVTRMFLVSGPQLCLLVLSNEEYEQAVTQGQDLRKLACAQRGDGWKPPRLCHITKNPVTGLGFSILPVEGEKGKFTMSPVTGGPAEKAGVRKGDRLVWINGAMACELTHSAISKMVKKCSDHMTVLVIDSESEKCYARRRMPILPVMADAQNMPYRPKKLHLEQGPDGYGFFLKQEKITTGRLVHILRDVDAGSPAELAGVKDGELLLEVNGESTERLSHDDVVNQFRKSGKEVAITTMTLHGQNFYNKLGLFPLLFIDDHSATEKKEKPASPEQSAAVVTLAAALAEAQEEMQVDPNVRLCVLQRGTLGFGFHLGCIQKKPGTFIQQITRGGPGESSGLLKDDVVVEVNGQNAENELLEDVILLMKKGANSLSLLVVDRPGYEWMKKNGKPITAEKVVKVPEVKEDVSPSSSLSTL